MADGSANGRTEELALAGTGGAEEGDPHGGLRAFPQPSSKVPGPGTQGSPIDVLP
jgi:hypothetical protein